MPTHITRPTVSPLDRSMAARPSHLTDLPYRSTNVLIWDYDPRVRKSSRLLKMCWMCKSTHSYTANCKCIQKDASLAQPNHATTKPPPLCDLRTPINHNLNKTCTAKWQSRLFCPTHADQHHPPTGIPALANIGIENMPPAT